MSRRAYLPIAVELPSRKGVTFEVLPAGTFNPSSTPNTRSWPSAAFTATPRSWPTLG